MIFALVARLAIWLLPHGLVRRVIVIIDDIVLIGLVAYFGWEMFVYLLNGRPAVSHNAAIRAGFAAAQEHLPSALAKPLDVLAHAVWHLADAPW